MHFSVIFERSVVKIFGCRCRRKRRFNTENTEGTEGTESAEIREVAERASLIHLCNPGGICGGLRAAAGGFFRNGERGNFVHGHVDGSHDDDLAL